MTPWLSRSLAYFYWLLFAGTIVLASGALSAARAIRGYHFCPLDVFATLALLGASVAILALGASLLLTGIDALTIHFNLRRFDDAPMGVVFVSSIVTYSFLLLHTLRSCMPQLRIPATTPMLFEAGAGIIGVGVFTRLESKTGPWIDETTRRLRVVGRWILFIYVFLPFYLFLEPLYKGHATPVAIATGRRPMPNVFIIILDALTARDMSLYGYRLPTTPNLDRLARHCVVYENAHSAGTGTLLMLPTVLTGRYPYSDDWPRYGDLARSGAGWVDLPHILKSFGYTTECVVSGFAPAQYHLHANFDRIVYGKLTLADLFNVTPAVVCYPPMMLAALRGPSSLPPAGPVPFPDVGYDDVGYDIAGQCLWDRTQRHTRGPLFLYLHTPRPHYPYLGAEFLGRFLSIKAGLADFGSQSKFILKPYPSSEQAIIDRLRLRYDENVRKADEEVGQFLSLLKHLNLYDNSLIVITADHGTNFVSGFQGQGTPLLAAAEHTVPLLIKLPGQTQGRRVTGLVSNVDISPTILEVLGAACLTSLFDGHSLLRSAHEPGRAIYVRLPNDCSTFGVVCGNLKLVRRNDGLHLYDLAHDPDEHEDLIARIEARELKQALDQFVRRMRFIQDGGDISQAPPLIDHVSEAR